MIRTLLFLLSFSGTALAQTPASVAEPRITLGWTTFLDEGPIDHFVSGGSVRFYISSRVGIEPEVLYLKGPGTDRDVTFIPHVTFDFGRTPRRSFYVTGGVGFLRQSQTSPFRFTSTEWTTSGGIGMKYFLTDRLFIAPEFRIGFEPILRATGSIGFKF